MRDESTCSIKDKHVVNVKYSLLLIKIKISTFGNDYHNISSPFYRLRFLFFMIFFLFMFDFLKFYITCGLCTNYLKIGRRRSNSQKSFNRCQNFLTDTDI